MCVCEESRFEGAACERKSCPDACNGRGRCQNMRYFASLKDPGEGNVFTYESNWDANIMYGCNCDDGVFGPDCSLRYCPHGDDPLTDLVIHNPSNAESCLADGLMMPNDRSELQVNEQQQIECKADSGYLVLSFRNKHTERIP
mmetsp:Transcript_23393/g.70211  ORF Transcript_23393/g.70211 Transcript_23393/m.70211 type:complete len:143 (+) Transcript_23393:240-668(+)